MPAQTPEDVDRLFGEYVNAGNAEGVVALYERAATLLTDSGAATGHAAIREWVTGFLAMKPRIQMSVDKVVEGGGDVAAVYNNWTLTATGPDGAAFEMAGRATEIVRRQADGTWLFVIDDPNMRT
jgi:uncharacterized protein (TIGR02246 family)